MTADEIQTNIDNILKALSENPASEIVEYSKGDKTVKKRRETLYSELSFWREELKKVSGRKRVVFTRF